MKENEECPVCLNCTTTKDTENIYISVCGHIMHKKCFDELIFNKHTKCPLCRLNFKDVPNENPGIEDDDYSDMPPLIPINQ